MVSLIKILFELCFFSEKVKLEGENSLNIINMMMETYKKFNYEAITNKVTKKYIYEAKKNMEVSFFFFF